jgi:hypothetical protein
MKWSHRFFGPDYFRTLRPQIWGLHKVREFARHKLRARFFALVSAMPCGGVPRGRDAKGGKVTFPDVIRIKVLAVSALLMRMR